MKHLGLLLWVVLLSLAATACAKRITTRGEAVLLEEERVEIPTAVAPAPHAAQSTPSGPGLTVPGRPEFGEGTPEGRRSPLVAAFVPSSESPVRVEDIFFDFDRAVVQRAAVPLLEMNASVLNAHTGMRILIEGHADERGTNDYNLVLGERRARAAREFLVALGVDPDRIAVISFGEERPFCLEQHEECYQQNRRDHFVIRDQ